MLDVSAIFRERVFIGVNLSQPGSYQFQTTRPITLSKASADSFDIDLGILAGGRAH